MREDVRNQLYHKQSKMLHDLSIVTTNGKRKDFPAHMFIILTVTLPKTLYANEKNNYERLIWPSRT